MTLYPSYASVCIFFCVRVSFISQPRHNLVMMSIQWADDKALFVFGPARVMIIKNIVLEL